MSGIIRQIGRMMVPRVWVWEGIDIYTTGTGKPRELIDCAKNVSETALFVYPTLIRPLEVIAPNLIEDSSFVIPSLFNSLETINIDISENAVLSK